MTRIDRQVKPDHSQHPHQPPRYPVRALRHQQVSLATILARWTNGRQAARQPTQPVEHYQAPDHQDRGHQGEGSELEFTLSLWLPAAWGLEVGDYIPNEFGIGWGGGIGFREARLC
jgi:hypothetical protein